MNHVYRRVAYEIAGVFALGLGLGRECCVRCWHLGERGWFVVDMSTYQRLATIYTVKE